MNDKEQIKLATHIIDQFYDDPAGYCVEILGYIPDDWARKVLESVRDNPLTAVRSGNGVGKTRLDASIIHWFLATRPHPQIDATAGRFTQLKDRLWRELAKINEKAVNREMFEWTQTSFYLKAKPELWKANAVPWSKNNPEAFAGAHEDHVLTVFDEASAIDDVIWEVKLGSMTTGGARWLSTGNPTRNKGKFAECFKKGKRDDSMRTGLGWNCFTVSSFDSPRVSKLFIDQVIQEYGKDSDYYRVHVDGLPPRQEDLQFISDELFESAVNRVNLDSVQAPRLLGVDVARTGGDRTVIVERRGMHLKKLLVRHGQDTMATVGDIVHLANEAREKGDQYDYILVDVIGIGAGVVDRLKEQNYKVIGVNSATEPTNKTKYRNLRAELWDGYKKWLSEGTIEEDFREDSCGIQYCYDSAGRLVMEKKDDMKSRDLHSPDMADAAVLTFFIQNAIRPTAVSIRPKTTVSGAGWRR